MSEQFGYDELQKYLPGYQIYLYINCGMISSMYPLCIYLLFVRTDVKLNLAYKYMLFGCATTSFLNSILYCLWAPVLTPEFFGVMITGILRHLGPTANLQFFKFALVILTNSELCTILLLVFQFSNLQPNSFLAIFGKSGKRLIISYFFYLGFLIAIAMFTVPFAANEPEQFKAYISKTNYPFARQIIAKNETFMTFVASLNPVASILASAELASSSFLFLLGFYYTVIVSNVIATTRAVVSHTTYTREKMMLRAFVFKTMMMLVFYAFPMFGYTVAIWADVKTPAFGMFMNIIMVSHGWISYCGTIALIGPYRRIVFSIILRIPENNVSMESSIAPSRSSMYRKNTASGAVISSSDTVSSNEALRGPPTAVGL